MFRKKSFIRLRICYCCLGIRNFRRECSECVGFAW